MKKNILFIDGVPDTNKVAMHRVNIDGSFSIQTSGSCNIYSCCLNQTDNFFFTHLILDRTDNQKISIEGVDAIFNQISEIDTHKFTLDKMVNLKAQVGDKISIFNEASNIKKCSRDTISTSLQNIDKVYIPKTIKIKPEKPQDIYDAIDIYGLQFPIIFRVAGDHGGVSTTLIKSFDDDAVFYPFSLDAREYYLTQYIDYQKNGLYKKYRLAVVDGQVFLRHVLFSDFWMVHASSREFMEKNPICKEQEIQIIDSFETNIKPKIKKQIEQIASYLNLEFFGIDCYIDDDFNILVFEINPNMNILVPNKNDADEKSIWNVQIQKIKDAIFTMIKEKL